MRGGNIQRLMGLIGRHRLEHFTEVRHWLDLIELGLMDDGLAEVLSFRCQRYIERQRRRPNLLEPDPTHDELYPGSAGGPDLRLGHLLEGPDVPIGMILQGAVHCIMSGTTGFGKSVILRQVTLAGEEFYRRTARRAIFIVLDRAGRDYVHLPRLLGQRWRHYDVNGALRLGLQNPAGVPPDIWINHIAQTFCARAGLQFARVTIANAMRGLLAALNPQPTDSLRFPDFRLILEVLRRVPKRTFSERDSYLESSMQILEDVVQGTGALFCTSNGLDLERDLISKGESAVISMPLLSPSWISHFVADLLVLQLLVGRAHRGQLTNRPEVFLVIDEADDDVAWDNERQFPSSMSPICRGMRLLREFGVGICLGVGSLAGLSRQVLNAATYHFVFKQSDDHAMDVASSVLMLPPGANAIIPTLQPGECLVRVPYWPHAMLASIHHAPADHQAQPAFDANQHVPSRTLDELPGLLNALHGRPSKTLNDAQTTTLTPESRALLVKASPKPYWPYIRLFDNEGRPPARVQIAIRDELEKKGFAEFEDIRLGSRPLALIQLTKHALEHIGKPPVESAGRGEMEHTHLAAWIRMVGEKRGYEESLVEWIVPGMTHPGDAAWRVNGRWRVFEVVVRCKRNLSSHLDAILRQAEVPIESVTIVASQQKDLRPLQEQIEGSLKFTDQLHRIRYEPGITFLRELWP